MMMIYPVAGRLVRDPATGRELDASGIQVNDQDFFWLRRLADGDVTTKAPAKTKEASK